MRRHGYLARARNLERAKKATHTLPLTFRIVTVAFLLILLASIAQAQSSKVWTVCSITLNSPDELEVMKKYLPKKEFKFVELVSSDPKWLDVACDNPTLACDMLIISGHFGGNFSGDKGHLELADLEERACNRKCQNVLNQPVEPWLMGCNVLATKKRDHRDLPTYLRVLQEHAVELGLSPLEREQVANNRYGEFGEQYRDRMRAIFWGVPGIQGYSSTGFLGEQAKPKLEKYFKENGKTYAQKLQKLSKLKEQKHYKQIEAQVRALNRSLNDAMSYSGFEQCSGFQEDNPNFAQWQARCKLMRTDLSTVQKLTTARQLLQGPSYLAMLPIIERYMTGLDLDKLSADERSLYNAIGDDPLIRDRIVESIKKVPTPLFFAARLSIAERFGWVNSTKADKLYREFFGMYFKGEVDLETKDIICSIPQSQIRPSALKLEDVNANTFGFPFSVQALTCLGVGDPSFRSPILKLLTDPIAEMQSQRNGFNALDTLKLESSDGPVLAAALERARSRSADDVAIVALDNNKYFVPDTTVQNWLIERNTYLFPPSFSSGEPGAVKATINLLRRSAPLGIDQVDKLSETVAQSRKGDAIRIIPFLVSMPAFSERHALEIYNGKSKRSDLGYFELETLVKSLALRTQTHSDYLSQATLKELFAGSYPLTPAHFALITSVNSLPIEAYDKLASMVVYNHSEFGEKLTSALRERFKKSEALQKLQESLLTEDLGTTSSPNDIFRMIDKTVDTQKIAPFVAPLLSSKTKNVRLDSLRYLYQQKRYSPETFKAVDEYLCKYGNQEYGAGMAQDFLANAPAELGKSKCYTPPKKKR